MVHHAGRAPYDLTFLEDDQSGYRLNPQLSGKCLVLIYINFKDTHLSRQLLPNASTVGLNTLHGPHHVAKNPPIQVYPL